VVYFTKSPTFTDNLQHIARHIPNVAIAPRNFNLLGIAYLFGVDTSNDAKAIPAMLFYQITDLH
jgi:hypothetical protein